MTKLLNEVDKCVVVCYNCHQEIHSPHLFMNNVVNHTIIEPKIKNISKRCKKI